MKAKKYFDKEYGNEHIKAVVDLKDLESLYRLMQEYADEQLVKFCDHLNTYAGLEDCRFDFMLVDFKQST